MKRSPLRLGHFELYSVETGLFWLDGGAIFGVVPKPLWSRHFKADESNRIPLAMRSLLVRSGKTGRTYLIDNGSGDKFDEKMRGIIGLDYDHSELIRSLGEIGVDPWDITDLIFTHLHYDHCGGTTWFDEEGELQDRFPRAIYHITRTQMEAALKPNAQEKASYLPENIGPISTSKRLNYVRESRNIEEILGGMNGMTGEAGKAGIAGLREADLSGLSELGERFAPTAIRYEDGLNAITVHGHTAGMQLPLIQAEGKTILFIGDLSPTHAHLPLPWIAAYDLFPLQTMEEKRVWLTLAVENGWYLYLQHDPDHELITVGEKGGKFHMKESLRLEDLA